jgi:hypothetical protein
MANRRTLEKQISLSLHVNELSDRAALLYTWAILHADDYGVIRADPRRLKAEVVPLREWASADVQAAVEEWVACGLVSYYHHDGDAYVAFPAFNDHQTGLERRTRARALPHPEFTEGCSGFLGFQWTSEKFREVQGSSVSREVKRRERKEQIPVAAIAPPEPTEQVADDQQPPIDDAKPKKKPKTRAGFAFEACLACYGVTLDDLDADSLARYSKAMNAVVADHGIEQVEAWSTQTGPGALSLGTGAKPDRKVPAEVRKALTAVGWQAAYEEARTKSNGGNGNGGGSGHKFPALEGLGEAARRNARDIIDSVKPSGPPMDDGVVCPVLGDDGKAASYVKVMLDGTQLPCDAMGGVLQ